jgi:hypothetical protein
MTLQEIKQAIKDSLAVRWSNNAYEVILDSKGEYLIHCTLNDNYIGLTWRDGETLNGDEKDFYITYPEDDVAT